MAEPNFDIEIAECYKPILKPKRWKIGFGGRGAGRSHTFARYCLGRALQGKIRIWCAREVQKSISQSVHHLFVELINQYHLNPYFKITSDDITCTATGSYFMFKGFRGDGGTYASEGLKAYEDFDILWIEEASACSMDSLMVVSKTIRKEGSEILVSFNRVLEEDPIWRFACYDCGDIYETHFFEDEDRLIFYATLDDNPFASDTLKKERDQDRKRLTIDEYNRVWLGYPDRSGGMKAFFTHDLIYGQNSVPSEEETQQWEVVCGFDPNGGGKDSACAAARQGRKILEIKLYRGIKDPLELAQQFIAFKRKYGAKRAYCDRGYGQGVIAIARQCGESIIPVDFGGRAVSNENCVNRRAEIYQKFKNWLAEAGYLGDPKDNEVVELKRELQYIEYNLRKSDDGKIALGPKDDIRKRLGHSPDRADAVALTFAGFKDAMVRDIRGGELSNNDFADDGDYVVNNFNNVDTTRLL